LPDAQHAASTRLRTHHGHTALLAEPSEEVIGSAEEVVRLENEVKALGLLRRKEEASDWFREREELEAQRRAEQQDEKEQARAEQET
jgi:hypothetical protein